MFMWFYFLSFFSPCIAIFPVICAWVCWNVDVKWTEHVYYTQLKSSILSSCSVWIRIRLLNDSLYISSILYNHRLLSCRINTIFFVRVCFILNRVELCIGSYLIQVLFV